MIYYLMRIKDAHQNGIKDLLSSLRDQVLPEAEKKGTSLYGIFFGLFGLASNELYLILNTSREDEGSFLKESIEKQGYQIPEAYRLRPTVRPMEHGPRARAGVYVFRWFLVFAKDVEEIVRLSQEAWVSFEEGFDSQVQGWFAETNKKNDRSRMLLLTWYRDLSVWEASRKPAQEAAERFRRRHALTLETQAVATRLYLLPSSGV